MQAIWKKKKLGYIDTIHRNHSLRISCILKFFLLMSDQSNIYIYIYISLINKTYESKLHKINSNIWYSPSPVSRAAHERDERALDTSLQIFRSESHVPPIYRPYVFHYVQISFHRLWHTIRVYQSPWTD